MQDFTSKVFDELIQKIPEEARQDLMDKIVWYLCQLKDATFTPESKKAYTLLNRYEMDDLISNPFTLADYLGGNYIIRNMYPELENFLLAEADLFLQILTLNLGDEIEIFKEITS